MLQVKYLGPFMLTSREVGVEGEKVIQSSILSFRFNVLLPYVRHMESLRHHMVDMNFQRHVTVQSSSSVPKMLVKYACMHV